MTLSEKTGLINRIASLPRDYVTLDGNPALICGLASDYLTIVSMTVERTHHDWSWDAVARVLDQGGAFKS